MNQANNDNKKEVNRIFNNSKLLIDRNIYRFLFELLQFIFIKDNKQEIIKKKIEFNIKKINNNWINNKEDYIDLVYSKKNLINIVKFVKQQNYLYTGEIIENILIIIFSFAFKTGKENIFCKYLYIDIAKLKQSNEELFDNWFNKNMLNEEFKNLTKLLRDEAKMKNKKINTIPDKPIFNFLLEIYEEKYNRKKKEKIMNYLNRRIFDFNNKKIQEDNVKNDETPKTGEDSFVAVNSYSLFSN